MIKFTTLEGRTFVLMVQRCSAYDGEPTGKPMYATDEDVLLAQRPLPHYEDWIKQHPKSAEINALVRHRQHDLEPVKLADEADVTEALHRMQQVAKSYLSEVAGLIDQKDSSEIFHHLGHVEFELESIRRLLKARAS